MTTLSEDKHEHTRKFSERGGFFKFWTVRLPCVKNYLDGLSEFLAIVFCEIRWSNRRIGQSARKALL